MEKCSLVHAPPPVVRYDVSTVAEIHTYGTCAGRSCVCSVSSYMYIYILAHTLLHTPHTHTHTHTHHTHTHTMDATLGHLGNGLCSIQLSPTSQAGLSSTVASTLSPPPCMGKPKMIHTFFSFHKKQRTSPVSKRSHYILVSPAIVRSDDMVHIIDERMIT